MKNLSFCFKASLFAIKWLSQRKANTVWKACKNGRCLISQDVDENIFHPSHCRVKNPSAFQSELHCFLIFQPSHLSALHSQWTRLELVFLFYKENIYRFISPRATAFLPCDQDSLVFWLHKSAKGNALNFPRHHEFGNRITDVRWGLKAEELFQFFCRQQETRALYIVRNSPL